MEEVYGKLAVSVRRVSSYGDITERRLEVEERGGKETHRVVTLLQMTGWFPQELPHPSVMLALVDLLSKAQRSSPSKHTIIMCRSADMHVYQTVKLFVVLCCNMSLLQSVSIPTVGVLTNIPLS